MALPRPRDPHAKQDWRRHYQIVNPDEVDRFLAEHPNVVPVLTQASVEITRRFGPDVELLLEYNVDPEDEPASEYLSLDIRTNLDDEEAFARRGQLDDEWWMDAIRGTGGDLTIDLALR